MTSYTLQLFESMPFILLTFYQLVSVGLASQSWLLLTPLVVPHGPSTPITKTSFCLRYCSIYRNYYRQGASISGRNHNFCSFFYIITASYVPSCQWFSADYSVYDGIVIVFLVEAVLITIIVAVERELW